MSKMDWSGVRTKGKKLRPNSTATRKRHRQRGLRKKCKCGRLIVLLQHKCKTGEKKFLPYELDRQRRHFCKELPRKARS